MYYNIYLKINGFESQFEPQLFFAYHLDNIFKLYTFKFLLMKGAILLCPAHEVSSPSKLKYFFDNLAAFLRACWDLGKSKRGSEWSFFDTLI